MSKKKINKNSKQQNNQIKKQHTNITNQQNHKITKLQYSKTPKTEIKESANEPKVTTKKENTQKSKDVKNIVYKVLTILVLLIGLASLIIFSYHLFKLNILPLKYTIVVYGLLFLLLIPIIIILFKKNHYVLKAILMIILIIMSSGCFYVNNYLKSTVDFLAKTESNIDKLSYSVLVLKDSKVNEIDDLKWKKISLLESDVTLVKNYIKISFTENINTNFSNMVHDLLDSKTDAIILESGYYTLAAEEIADFEGKTKVIYTFEVSEKIDSSSLSDASITTDPFILYISGIDQRGKITSVRGRSDVNQLLVVNPKTHKILIVNTPRDYYVQLHGTTGLKDKLTHAGIYGINKSVETLEDLYNIDIDHYLRVNFNTLETLVDVIGGIDVYSDISFDMTHIKGRHVFKGMNHFDGKEALAYSRERYAYRTGDNHRGQNQQDVIEAIIDKVSTSEVLIKKYPSILKTMEGTFQTDLSMDDITSLVKMQLASMPKWEIESIAVTGTGSSNYTYSMGHNYRLYVMEPNMASINNAKAKISEVLNEN